MIRTRVSAVFQIRDGFTGRIIEGSSLLCLLDGVPIRPLAKPGGYLVLVDLPGGAHLLTIRCNGFQEEYVHFTVEDNTVREGYVALKPGRQYPFHQSVTRLKLTVPPAQKAGQIWISAPSPVECKVAQTSAEPGCNAFRVYCKGNPALLPIPGVFLIEDGEDSEIVILRSLSEESVQLSEPLCRRHGRSRRLLPVQQYRPDDQGQIYAAFTMPGTAVVFRGGNPQRVELAEGENEWRLDME